MTRRNGPNWRFDGEFVHNDDVLNDDGFNACRGILCGALLGALVWAVAILVWWWL